MIYDFTLSISRPNVDYDSAANLLFEAGCSDALFGVSGGEYQLDFSREATSFHEAVFLAIRDVRSAGLGVAVSLA